MKIRSNGLTASATSAVKLSTAGATRSSTRSSKPALSRLSRAGNANQKIEEFSLQPGHVNLRQILLRVGAQCRIQVPVGRSKQVAEPVVHLSPDGIVARLHKVAYSSRATTKSGTHKS